MPKRDERWEFMWGYIGEPDYDIEYDCPRPGEWVEFRMEVRYKGMTWYSVHQIATKDLEDLNFRLETERWLLDKMVTQIDERLDEVDAKAQS